MIDVASFHDDLRLYALRLVESVDALGAFCPDQLTWVAQELLNLVVEIEDGYEAILRPPPDRRSQAAPGVGARTQSDDVR